MKVYRFLTWPKTGTEDEKKSQNELINYKKGLISPSHSFLRRHKYFGDCTANTFGKETEMTKFFFASLADAMSVFSTVPVDNTVIEVDLPEEILRKYIGVGFYDNNRIPYIEFRVPYKVVYENLTQKKLDYFHQALEFYNDNLYTYGLENEASYHEIETLLSEVPYQNISHINRFSIYPLFCFDPIPHNSLDFTTKELEVMQSISQQFQKIRMDKANFWPRLEQILKKDEEQTMDSIFASLAKKQITIKEALEASRRENFLDPLYNLAYPLIEEENQELRKFLRK